MSSGSFSEASPGLGAPFTELGDSIYQAGWSSLFFPSLFLRSLGLVVNIDQNLDNLEGSQIAHHGL